MVEYTMALHAAWLCLRPLSIQSIGNNTQTMGRTAVMVEAPALFEEPMKNQ
jgi:hypothetical protein